MSAMKPADRLGPYEVVALLGAGGMGEVYRAQDTRLGRDVAVKVLPAQFAANPDRLRRFEQEGRAVAALSHPNILALYDVGTHEGSPFIVSELLEGETLRERLRSGGLTIRKAVETAVQIAQGLAAAHEKGIVHRDLKPANVFVTKDGHVKILDFGIAKLTRPDPGPQATTLTPEPSTETGALMGTVGYMSPEQVRGLPADHRTDIFSFGCVLYEMLSGRSPFRKDTAAETMTAILHEDPPSLADSRTAIPPALEGIVGRCLEKGPDDRFGSAHDLALALQAASSPGEAVHFGAGGTDVAAPARRRRLVGLALVSVGVLAAAGMLVLKLKPADPTTRVTGRPKIVVLPFENLGAPEDAYFAAGMTEEITSRLANVQGLGVISRTSAMEYNRKGKTVKQIGSDLGVDYVLEGSVRWDRGAGRESRVRITPQLIRVADDTHVWADRYERVIADVFAMQSEVAENAVKAMGVTLLPREQTALKELSTNDLEAYNLYLRGRELSSGGLDRSHVEGALQMYQAAIDRDPRFAQALAGLAESHSLMYWLYRDRSPERLLKAKELAERAVELRPDLAETHNALGSYFSRGPSDLPRALTEFATALKIQPNNSDALAAIGYVLRRQGHWADSAETLSKALELDPRNPTLVQGFAQTCVFARRYAEADRAFGLAIALSPKWRDPYLAKAWLQVQWRGDLGKAQAIVEEGNRVAGLADDERFLPRLALRLALARRDDQEALRQLAAQPRRTIDGYNYYWPFTLFCGWVQRLAGQHDLARRFFDAARLELEQKVAQDPDDARFHSSLGVAYAGLSRRVEAVQEARLGCDLMPPSKDALRALPRIDDLAGVYTMVGQTAEAIAQLDDLLARSGDLTPHVLRLQPEWDPLRSDPRFQALLTKYEVKP
jgi:TolB-like protein/Tfp pilus assembly protein PilF